MGHGSVIDTPVITRCRSNVLGTGFAVAKFAISISSNHNNFASSRSSKGGFSGSRGDRLSGLGPKAGMLVRGIGCAKTGSKMLTFPPVALPWCEDLVGVSGGGAPWRR